MKKPVQILHGALDPVVVKKNLDDIVRANGHAKLTVIPAGHELLGTYIPAAVKAIEAVLRQR